MQWQTTAPATKATLGRERGGARESEEKKKNATLKASGRRRACALYSSPFLSPRAPARAAPRWPPRTRPGGPAPPPAATLSAYAHTSHHTPPHSHAHAHAQQPPGRSSSTAPPSTSAPCPPPAAARRVATRMGNKATGGPFAPLVVVFRNAMGVKEFNMFRGKAISLHSQGADGWLGGTKKKRERGRARANTKP